MNFRYLLRAEGKTIQAMWVAMGSLSSFALAIVSAAILSRYFNKTDYGTYRQILYVYNTLLIIFSAGLPSVFAYFLPRYTAEQGKDIVIKVTKVLLIAGGVFSIFLFLTADIIASLLKNPELGRGLRIFSPIPLLLLPTLGIDGIFSTYKKTIYIAIYNTVSRSLMLLFIVLPVILFKGTYVHAIYGWLVVSVLMLIIALYYKNIPFRGLIRQGSSLTLREIFGYSLPLVGASLWGMAIRSADQFYISRYFGTEVFAEFSNGFIDLPFVGMVTGATSVVLMPLFSKLIHENINGNGTAALLELWRNALTKSAIIIYPIVIFFLFNSRLTVVALYSETYANSAIYFSIAMMLNFFNIIVFAPLLFALGETRFYARMHMYFAFIAWAGGYMIVIGFNSPVILAVFSTVMAVVKITVSMKHVGFMLNIRAHELIPGRKIMLLLLHSLLVMITVKSVIGLISFPLENLLMLALSFVFFGLLLLLTARLFNLNYISVIKPIIQGTISR